jgi:hypothetical protein
MLKHLRFHMLYKFCISYIPISPTFCNKSI